MRREGVPSFPPLINIPPLYENSESFRDLLLEKSTPAACLVVAATDIRCSHQRRAGLAQRARFQVPHFVFSRETAAGNP